MKGSTEEITFFKRLKIAILELENYGNFLLEGIAPAIKYIFMLLLISAVVYGAVSTYSFSKMVYKVTDYLKNELPEFTYENGELSFSNDVEAYDEEYKFSFFVNTNSEINETTIEEYKNKIVEDGIILLNNKAIIEISDTEIEMIYTDMSDELGITTLNKSDLLDKIDYDSIMNLSLSYLFTSVITNYLISIVSITINVFAVTILAIFAAKLCALAIDIRHLIALSIYSVSLSIILNTIYQCVVTIKNIEIPYFDTVCFLISCIYIIAAMFMIKADVIRQKQELAKIIEEQQKIKKEKELEELSNDKEDEKEKTDDEKKDKKQKENKKDKKTDEEEPLINKEPDGSEI